jgi:hypothetical protein
MHFSFFIWLWFGLVSCDVDMMRVEHMLSNICQYTVKLCDALKNLCFLVVLACQECWSGLGLFSLANQMQTIRKSSTYGGRAELCLQ